MNVQWRRTAAMHVEFWTSPGSRKMMMMQLQIVIVVLRGVFFPASCVAIDFLINSFSRSDLVLLDGDARVDAAVLRLTNDSNRYSYGRAFYPSRIPSSSSFSTSFVFSVLPEIDSSPGFGLAFVLSNSTSPAGALAGQYFGIFSNATVPTFAPLLAVEFDTGQNPEFNDPDGNHVGIDLNNIESAFTRTAGYYDDSASGNFVAVDMRNGQNVRAWIDFDRNNLEFNVTLAPAGVSRPSRPLLTYRDPAMANYLAEEAYAGFSASKTTWVEAQRILAWSFSNEGVLREINTTDLPVFVPETASSHSLSTGAVSGIAFAAAAIFVLCVSMIYWYLRRTSIKDEEIEDWELEYWPHRFSYEELSVATNGCSVKNHLGSGGFGKVYKGTLPNRSEVAVKCINHDSKQGLREFMAEISSIGRLQHKNLVQMRGWCRKDNELMLVYDYMPNGSLNNWIFDGPKTVMNWNQRRRVLADVAEGLNYLHHGWDQVVIHRDIKASNILLDSHMRGKLGDFGLAKLYQQGNAPSTTRVVGTLGYMPPELASSPVPTAASDVYGFGVVVLEVACGRRPIITWMPEEKQVLVDWVRNLYVQGKVTAAADTVISGQFAAAEMEAVLKLGLTCCHPDPLRRPSMKEVVALLLGEEPAAKSPAFMTAGDHAEEGKEET